MRSIVFALLAAQLARAFSFRTTPPTQCGEWTVEWDGGSPPFYMIVVPTMAMDAGRIENISMPASGSAPYRHSFTLREPAGLQLVATMYDAEGFGSGGATELLTVGNSSDTTCLDKEVNADFYFWTRPISAPAQCGNMEVTWNENAQSPIGLHGIVIGGTAWDIPVPLKAESQRTMDWTVNLASGTQFLLLMSDGGPYGTGGSTTILTAGESVNNDACLDASSPHSTSVPPLLSTSTTQTSPSATAPSTVVSSTSAPPTRKTEETRRTSVSHSVSTSSSPHTSFTGTPAATSDARKGNHVVGVAVGVTIAILLLILLGLCLLCRHRKKAAVAKGKQTGSPSYMAQQPQMEEGSSGPRQMLHRLTATGRQSHMRVSSRAFDNRPASMAVGPIAGLPNGAYPPSVFTNDSASERYELHPFPYEAPPPFHSLAINTSLSSDIKSPQTLNSANPFLDPPSSRDGSQVTLLSPANGYDKSDSNESSPFTHQLSVARSSSPAIQSPASAVDNVSRTACGVIPHDPPPVYVPSARLRATNPDPRPASEYSALQDDDNDSDTSSTQYSPSLYGRHRRHRSAVSMVSLL